MQKIMTIFGTRPEAIKMAPVIKAIDANPDTTPIVVLTGQHKEMLQQVLDIFDIHPDADLKVMARQQTLSQITSKVILGLDPILDEHRPDLVLVHGDTTTTMAAGLSAFYHQIPVGHVEAGLRTWDKYSPYPEEMNRMLTDDIADLYFAPTQLSKDNLLQEHHPESRIFITGNTAIDALKYTVHADYHHPVLEAIPQGHKFILLTMHRRENQGQAMRNTFMAIRNVVLATPDLDVIYPVHLSPRVQQVAHEIFDDVEGVHLIEPLDVTDFHGLASQSYFIMTDSGGVQEEAPSLNKPVLVLRDSTERPEGVTAGTLKVIGTETEAVSNAMTELLNDQREYRAMSTAVNPYGDGHAAERIVAICRDYISGKLRHPGM
ncbi:non-hydrolyzing UDP-N-acetylglucosamine 2-epimerase [Bifidobacterium crudilactis]|jgi:UDP-N-acetylglucosamine 2-epimerase (non-hydrolysing)|nr:UDP-N-acetylglucosamine 2-epimerase (non-hydrolyzing) [Bifidobacterium crudilactis]MDN5972169.1 UDP-N-acetylglucosamine 2-epimerase (non-hydrolyzing) [Bifidobacterium crudilactis]MDN6000653.1 UDP-N-acetylglucosamine 2-epimerase (non-hydrolyzing) [Bifidobacterium crudilactis]MDN6208564.1 UDP-N-acetylglucosamine 2-epimerase (non-hydrolyzing) [Bifidobacterium crudilactis]MDN6233971.1 UDP-N-acetylglucosamine 2-epimerase (non-hydrolyzing) [Bifidobacterium crudilactis]MDN6271242.1 UDP-N-acetylglu